MVSSTKIFLSHKKIGHSLVGESEEAKGRCNIFQQVFMWQISSTMTTKITRKN